MERFTDTVEKYRRNGRRNGRVARFILMAALALLLPVIFQGVASAEAKKDKRINCDIQQHACTQEIQGCTVTLDIGPRPVTAMENLKFTVTFSGSQPVAAPHIDLGMPGMKMGKNRVALTRTGQGGYEGEGVIVRCPSGRRTWRAKVTVPGIGEAAFVFDVIY